MILIDTSCSLAELILILIDRLSKLKLDNGIDIEMERKPAKIGRKLIRKPFGISLKRFENSQNSG